MPQIVDAHVLDAGRLGKCAELLSEVSAPSNELPVVVCGVGCAVPGAVTSLTFAISGSDVLLTWRAPADGVAPTGYLIEAGTASGLSNLGQFATGNTAEFINVPGEVVRSVRVGVDLSYRSFGKMISNRDGMPSTTDGW